MQSCRAAAHRSPARDLPGDQRGNSERETLQRPGKMEKTKRESERKIKQPVPVMLLLDYAGSERRYSPLLLIHPHMQPDTPGTYLIYYLTHLELGTL